MYVILQPKKPTGLESQSPRVNSLCFWVLTPDQEYMLDLKKVASVVLALSIFMFELMKPIA